MTQFDRKVEGGLVKKFNYKDKARGTKEKFVTVIKTKIPII